MNRPRLIRPRLALLLFSMAAGALSPLAGSACLWDRDTLDHEAAGIPDVIRVITGRFERNPSLYYQMRLERVRKQLQKEPGNLDLYDDAAVACDRLGRDDDAIALMDRKRQALKRSKEQGGADHAYRLHANLGTFFAHKWIRGGARPEDASLLRKSIDELQSALKINPQAHFGRERYQLWIIEALAGRAKITDPKDDLLGNILMEKGHSEFWTARVPGDDRDKLTKGLCGLIVLGNAWEIPDAYEALSKVLAAQRMGVVSYLAALRSEDLLKSGRRSLFNTDLPARMRYVKRETMAPEDIQPTLNSQYRRLRIEADQYQNRRTAYMLARLEKGRHPDTDPAFWNEWRDPGPPSLKPTTVERANLWARSPNGAAVILLGLFAAAIVAGSGVWAIHRRRVRRALGEVKRPLRPA